jgi:4-amino-4-deoxy-L-arabinose transferase-like glycosyltransferase
MAAAEREALRFAAVVAALTLLAFALRAAYFTGATVPVPIVGDIGDYWKYAWNLVHHGVFSHANPSDAVPAPDSWRGPGYPFFLSLCLRAAQDDVMAAVRLAQWTQIVLGSLLVPLTVAVGRRWLTRDQALVAGAAVALWPHLIVFASTLLSETVFALLLLLALWLLALARERGKPALMFAAGVTAGLATLVNPLLLLFPPVLALLLAWRGQRRQAGALLVAFALVVGAWSWRNADLPPGASSAERARANFVQGSWPLYHAAQNDRFRDPIAAGYFNGIEREIELVNANPRAGYAHVFDRLRSEPASYALWYLYKPWLLWDWGVRVGWGDVYFLETRRSPFERVAIFRAVYVVAKALNPVVFLLALLAALASLATLRRLPQAPEPAVARLQVALLCCYVTAVHTVLQAEPRYAIAYRPLELLLAVSAFAFAARAWAARRTG